MTVDEVIAREQIRELVARYNTLGDLGQVAMVADLFAEDATLEVGDRSRARILRGRSEIRAFLDAIREEWGRNSAPPSRPGAPRFYVRHFVGTHTIDICSPDYARGSAYVIVFRPTHPPGSARYFDEYGKRGGKWVFLSRRALADQESSASGLLPVRDSTIRTA